MSAKIMGQPLVVPYPNWKYVGTTTGGTITIPDDAQEIYFLARWVTNPQYAVASVVNMSILDVANAHRLEFGMGGAWTANNGGTLVIMQIAGRTIKIINFNVENRGDVASTCPLYVWYR